MADLSHLYPPAPPGVPADLTAPSPSYRFRVVVVLVSLMAFLVIYLGLTVGSAYFCYYCFAWLAEDDPQPAYNAGYDTRNQYGSGRPYRSYSRRNSSSNEKPSFWLFIGGVSSGLMCLFLVKGLFKRSRRGEAVRVEVTEKEQPDLYAFIRKLCQETKAPFPHRVFLVPDVNAAVAFDESFLNLVFPSRKNLIIGLGLVNRLNLTEFKAVLAHEFGHFSQKSMKLGSYVYSANRVIGDVVYGRDWLDDLLGTLRSIDIRISIFAWGFTGILWVMRKSLERLFKIINFANSSLSRQMEYHADLVAVSVTGSDALVFALARLDFASDTLSSAWADLNAAADHGRFSRDLYFHQTSAADYIRLRRNDPSCGEVPALPDDPAQTIQVFKPEDTSVPLMWATHPSNHDREVNSKRRYIRGPIDERSPWELFAESAAIREAMTRKIYESARKVQPETLEDPEAVQQFIDAEHAETTYDARYCGFYDNRYLKPGELDELCCKPAHEEFEDRERLQRAFVGLFDEDLKSRMKTHQSRHEEVGRLAPLTQGAVELAGTSFEHRGGRFGLAEAHRLLKEVQAELDQDYDWMHARDRDVFRIHYAMALQAGEAHRAELEERYRFHLASQNMYSLLVAHNQQVQGTLAGLSGQRQVDSGVFQYAVEVLREARKVLSEQLDLADKLLLPPLTNMKVGEPLGRFLLSAKLVRKLPAEVTSLDGGWIGELLGQYGEVLDRLQRVLFKSLGALLATQERIANQWLAAMAEETAASPREEAAAE